MAKKFKWTVEIEIDEVWVADGFELTEERLIDMVQSDLQYATESEIKVKILKSPDEKAISKAQGYEE